MVHSARNRRRRSRERSRQRREVFHPGPPVPGHTLRYVRNAWIIDQTLVACSRSEFCCLKLLLEHWKQPVAFEQFFAQLRKAALLDDLVPSHQAKVRLSQLVSQLREKLWPLGLDIASVGKVGYMLFAPDELQTYEQTNV